MSDLAAGAFVGGYVLFYLKTFAVTPATAGVGGAVRYAVSHGLRRVDVGVNVAFVSLAFTVNTP
jgi:hypothetical protein